MVETIFSIVTDPALVSAREGLERLHDCLHISDSVGPKLVRIGGALVSSLSMEVSDPEEGLKNVLLDLFCGIHALLVFVTFSLILEDFERFPFDIGAGLLIDCARKVGFLKSFDSRTDKDGFTMVLVLVSKLVMSEVTGLIVT